MHAPDVILASPVSHPPRVRHSFKSSGPAAEWMAPSTEIETVQPRKGKRS